MDLEHVLKEEENYTFLNFLKNNIGATLTSISLFTAILVFVAKVIGVLIANVQYLYWNIDDCFLIEDNKAYLKLGIYIIYSILIMSSYAIAKKHIFIWKIHGCQIYLYDRILKIAKKQIKEHKKEHRAFEKRNKTLKKYLNLIISTEKSIDQNYSKIGNDFENLEARNEEHRKSINQGMLDYRDARREIIKQKLFNLIYLMIGFFIAFIASFILQASTGLNLSINGEGRRIILSTLLYAVFIIIGVCINCWIEIKLGAMRIISAFFKDKNIFDEQELVSKAVRILEDKANEVRCRSVKQIFSDKSCKFLAVYGIYLLVTTLVFMPIKARYNLEHCKTFYIISEKEQDYAVVVNNGNKFILSKCEIMGEKITIDTNEIYIMDEPVKMSKRDFKNVEKK